MNKNFIELIDKEIKCLESELYHYSIVKGDIWQATLIEKGINEWKALKAELDKNYADQLKQPSPKTSVEIAFENLGDYSQFIELTDMEKRELLRKIYVGSDLEKFVNKYTVPSESLRISQGEINLIEEQHLIDTEVLD